METPEPMNITQDEVVGGAFAIAYVVSAMKHGAPLTQGMLLKAAEASAMLRAIAESHAQLADRVDEWRGANNFDD